MNNPQLLRAQLSKLPSRQTRLSLPPLWRDLYACYSMSSTRAPRGQQDGRWADRRVKMLYSHQQWGRGYSRRGQCLQCRIPWVCGQGTCNQLPPLWDEMTIGFIGSATR